MAKGKGLISRIKNRLFGRSRPKVEICPTRGQLHAALAEDPFNITDTSIENLESIIKPMCVVPNVNLCSGQMTFKMRDDNVKGLLRAFLNEDYGVAVFRVPEKRVRTFHYVRIVEKEAMDKAVSVAHYQSLIREKLKEIDEGMRAKGTQEAVESIVKAANAAADVAFDELLMADTSIEALASKITALPVTMTEEWKNDVPEETRDDNVKSMLRAFLDEDYGVASFRLPSQRVKTFHYVRKAEMWALAEAINMTHYQSIIRIRLEEIDEGMTAQSEAEYEAAVARAAAAAEAADPKEPEEEDLQQPEEAAPALMRVD